MKKIIVLLLLSTIAYQSCKKAEKEIDKIEIAKKFYVAIDNSNHSKVTGLITEEFTTIDDGYEQKYTRNEYAEWVKWDSVFQPTYEILKIEKVDDIVKAKISKIDKRISFLHDQPIIMNETILLDGNRIMSVERTSVSFNVEKFIKRRDEFVSWVEENHPDLNGFLHDQTLSGGIKYLKAIELFKVNQ